MRTLPLQADLADFTVVLPHNDCLPKNAPKERLDLMLHHAQVEAQEKAYGKIEQETGMSRDQLTHRWFDDGYGTSHCVFFHRDDPFCGAQCPGISVQMD